MFETSLLIKGQYSLVRIAFYNYFDDFHKKLSFWFHPSSNKFCSKGNTVWLLWYCLCRVFWILLILKLTFNIAYYSATSLCLTSFHGMAAWNFLEKKIYGPFLWMGFNYLKVRAPLRRQFTFYHWVPRNFWYSFDRPRKDERLSQPWSYPVVLNTGTPGLGI